MYGAREVLDYAKRRHVGILGDPTRSIAKGSLYFASSATIYVAKLALHRPMSLRVRAWQARSKGVVQSANRCAGQHGDETKTARIRMGDRLWLKITAELSRFNGLDSSRWKRDRQANPRCM